MKDVELRLGVLGFSGLGFGGFRGIGFNGKAPLNLLLNPRFISPTL